MIIKVLNKSGNPLPRYMTAGAAGMDVYAADDAILNPKEVGKIGTGLTVVIPEGWYLAVNPRSGLAFKNKVTLINCTGIIDEDYTQEICVLLINLGDLPFTVKKGDRIAQFILQKKNVVTWEELSEEEFSKIERVERGGFGSTGVSEDKK